MWLPPNKTEAEVMEAIEKVVALLAPSFAFGYYAQEDIAQEARIFAIQSLENYDTSRPLVNFLYRHVKNRLINLRRDKLCRSDTPCQKCHDGYPCSNGDWCDKYRVWLERNSVKANLMRPLDINYAGEQSNNEQSSVGDMVEISELCRMLDERIPLELRADYLQMREGVSLSKTRREAVEQAVRDILYEVNNDQDK